MCDHCKDTVKNDIVVTQDFGYGSIFDGDIFHFDGNVSDLEKIFGKSQYELVYKSVELNNEGHISKGEYKSGGHCHICNKDLFEGAGETSFYNDVKEVCNSVCEKVVVIGPIDDSWGIHNINVCEQCIKKYMEAYIITYGDE